MLRLDGIRKRFGTLKILDGVSAEIQGKTVTAFIGPNGAGKTTLFHTISGDLIPDAGRVELAGRNITGMPPWRIARLGLGKQFQDVRVFRNLSCEDNLVLALYNSSHHQAIRAPWSFLPGLGIGSRPLAQLREEARWGLGRVGLAGQAGQMAGALSFGNQKLLAFARLLAGQFTFLLLDEPASGVSAATLERITEIIRRAVAEGVTVALIEHNMHFVAQLADTTYVLKDGAIFDRGPTEDVLRRPANRELCMGM